MNAKNKDIRQNARFWRKVLVFGGIWLVFGNSKMEELIVRRQDYKGSRCEKVRMSKCASVVKTYDAIGSAYAKIVQADDSVQSFETCIPLIGVGEDKYMTDFLIKMQDGTMRVRECVWRKTITKPMTINQLEMSLAYWKKRGIADWGIVIDKE